MRVNDAKLAEVVLFNLRSRMVAVAPVHYPPTGSEKFRRGSPDPTHLGRGDLQTLILSHQMWLSFRAAMTIEF